MLISAALARKWTGCTQAALDVLHAAGKLTVYHCGDTDKYDTDEIWLLLPALEQSIPPHLQLRLALYPDPNARRG